MGVLYKGEETMKGYGMKPSNKKEDSKMSCCKSKEDTPPKAKATPVAEAQVKDKAACCCSPKT